MVLCGGLCSVRVFVTFNLMCVHMIFSSVLVVAWPPFGKEQLTRLTICSQRFRDVSSCVCSYIFRLVWLVECPSFRNELLTRLTIVIFPFRFLVLDLASGCLSSCLIHPLSFEYSH